MSREEIVIDWAENRRRTYQQIYESLQHLHMPAASCGMLRNDNASQYSAIVALDAMNVAATEGVDACEGEFLESIAAKLFAAMSHSNDCELVRVEVQSFVQERGREAVKRYGLECYQYPRTFEVSGGEPRSLHAQG